MIISLARAAGATVWGQTGSAAKAQSIADQGAERVIVAGPGELAGPLAELTPTVAFDPLGGAFTAPVIDAPASGGRLVSFGTSAGAEVTFNMQQLYRKTISLLGYGGMALPRGQRFEGLQAALAALADGAIRVRVDEELPLHRVNEAFARLTDRGVQGKLLFALG
ncbi:MAG: zinc-binding dehydrogenase [Solirubrobacteraceae bacterium]|jgi:NADPH2:quinone reductase